MLLTVDPALRNIGIALWDADGKLLKACLVKGPLKERGPVAWGAIVASVLDVLGNWTFGITRVVVEVPQVYRNGKGDPADLIEVAGVAGAIVGYFYRRWSRGYLPKEWGGQVPKPIKNIRAEEALSDVEKACIVRCAPSLMNNVWDAVAIGLFHLGRY